MKLCMLLFPLNFSGRFTGTSLVSLHFDIIRTTTLKLPTTKAKKAKEMFNAKKTMISDKRFGKKGSWKGWDQNPYLYGHLPFPTTLHKTPTVQKNRIEKIQAKFANLSISIEKVKLQPPSSPTHDDLSRDEDLLFFKNESKPTRLMNGFFFPD